VKAQQDARDWVQALRLRGEHQEQDPKKFAAQIQTDKMIELTTDGGA
jgi:hypothetical protein